MADKYLQNVGGSHYAEVEGATTGGAVDANKIPALDTAGRFPLTMMPTGMGADTIVVQASENLAAGAFVNLHDVAGDFRVRNADASAVATKAHGFVLAAVTSGNDATVYREGSNTALTGLTPGDVWLSTTAGGVTQTAPTTAGAIQQTLGVASAATILNVEIQKPIVLA